MNPRIFISLSISVALIVLGVSFSLYGSRYDDVPVSAAIPHDGVSQESIIISTGRIYDPTLTGIVSHEYDVRGVSMQPMIDNGDTVTVDLNYYNQGQHVVATGDIVIFENPFTLNKIIKRVVMIPGDRVEKDLEKGTLIVNGKTLMNSVGESYRFDERTYRWIDIYAHSGVITKNIYYLYGDNIHNSLDSRQTGPVTLEGILGKVVGVKKSSDK